MTESKHTPGPWREGREFGTVVAGRVPAPFGQDRSNEAYYGGELIAESIGNRADAELIIRAPDLLREIEELRAQNAELLEALAGMDSLTQDSAGVAGYHLNGNIAEWDEFDEVEVMRTAIAKAKVGAE